MSPPRTSAKSPLLVLASMRDGRLAPRLLTALDSITAFFGANGDVFFVGGDYLRPFGRHRDVVPGGREEVTESVSIHFDRIRMATAGNSFCWDVSANRAC